MTNNELKDKLNTKLEAYNKILKDTKNELTSMDNAYKSITDGLDNIKDKEVEKLSELAEVFEVYEVIPEQVQKYYMSPNKSKDIYKPREHRICSYTFNVEINKEKITLSSNGGSGSYCYDTYQIFPDGTVKPINATNESSSVLIQAMPIWKEQLLGCLIELLNISAEYLKTQVENRKKDIENFKSIIPEGEDQADKWNDYLLYLVKWVSTNTENKGASPESYEDFLNK